MSEERKPYVDAIDNIQTGAISGRDAQTRIQEDERQGDDLERLLPNVRLVNGATKSETRQRLMLAFNSPFFPEVLIASSVMAEGVDLHRFCRYVIHHDLCWNPSTLEQRTGRIDRPGGTGGPNCVPLALPVLSSTEALHSMSPGCRQCRAGRRRPAVSVSLDGGLFVLDLRRPCGSVSDLSGVGDSALRWLSLGTGSRKPSVPGPHWQSQWHTRRSIGRPVASCGGRLMSKNVRPRRHSPKNHRLRDCRGRPLGRHSNAGPAARHPVTLFP